MESLKLSLEPNYRFTQEVYYGSAVENEVIELVAKKVNEPERAVEYVATWLTDYMGPEFATDYFSEPDVSHEEIMLAYDNCRTEDQKLHWHQQYGKWLKYRPNIQARFNQLVDLLDSERKLEKVFPEIQLKMVNVPYMDIANNIHPHYSAGDTHTRIDKPGNILADLYKGDVVVENSLLNSIRGLDIPVGQVAIQKTAFASLNRSSNKYADCGLMLVSENLYSLESLQIMQDFTGVNTLSAGLPEGIALAMNYRLPMGSNIGFPKPIPGTNGLYAGLTIDREFINDPYRDYPRLVFRIWHNEGTANCLLAITSD
jgi:hypothetical protein